MPETHPHDPVRAVRTGQYRVDVAAVAEAIIARPSARRLLLGSASITAASPVCEPARPVSLRRHAVMPLRADLSTGTCL
jgi:hypothetical protein